MEFNVVESFNSGGDPGILKGTLRVHVDQYGITVAATAQLL